LRINDCSAIIDCMASITIRNLDDETKARLRLRAARHQRSMEEEARTVLRQALAVPDAPALSLAGAIRHRFRALGGIELQLPARGPIRVPPKPGK
jgi:plasmid stability protein